MTKVTLAVRDSNNALIDITFYMSSGSSNSVFKTAGGKTEIKFEDKLFVLGFPAFVEHDGKLLMIDAPTTVLVESDTKLEIRYKADSQPLKVIADTIFRLTAIEAQNLDARLGNLEDANLDPRVIAVEGRLAAIETQNLDGRLINLEGANFEHRVSALEGQEPRLQALEETNRKVAGRLKDLEDAQSALKKIVEAFSASNAIEVIPPR